ncbi:MULTISPECIES: 1-phosphofructokinase family hexose kinase [Microbacterium]|uniref:1-phosphofructokinase family hexose kinase n=1 Tax=Microbacterium wangchenii TaxID=2541726 RepID=A0ABX5SSF2_9MICO|nr:MULTISPECIES: hexose kinase [Microbacterium]MCK6065263.1 hexose kinase [Microbacterium sp. EYE_512]QBR88712.1 1-phosphofructokinase family hexose kinase [Microbacterium wangchenii]
MILTLTPNPALDLTYRIDALQPGETHRVSAGPARAGGKGINVARVLHTQGFPVRAVLTAGGATGAQVVADLQESGIAHEAVPVGSPTRRTIAVVEDGDGTTTLLSESGAALSEDERARLHAAVQSPLPIASCLVISGSLPAGFPPEEIAAMVASSRSRGIPVIVDTSGPALLAAAAAGADLLKPNAAELAEATGERDLAAGAQALLDLGADTVLVSLGEEGMLAAHSASAWTRAALPRVLRGNPTGAGDAGVAAAAMLLAQGAPTAADLLRAATSWSAAAVLMPLAGEISRTHRELAVEVALHPYPDSEERP